MCPIYEYTCTRCNLLKEELRPLKDRYSPLFCVKCWTNSMQLVTSKSNVRIYGIGVYKPSSEDKDD